MQATKWAALQQRPALLVSVVLPVLDTHGHPWGWASDGTMLVAHPICPPRARRAPLSETSNRVFSRLSKAMPRHPDSCSSYWLQTADKLPPGTRAGQLLRQSRPIGPLLLPYANAGLLRMATTATNRPGLSNPGAQSPRVTSTGPQSGGLSLPAVPPGSGIQRAALGLWPGWH